MNLSNDERRLLDMIAQPSKRSIRVLLEVLRDEPRWFIAAREAHKLSREQPEREDELWDWVGIELFEACRRYDVEAMCGVSSDQFRTSAILALGFMSYVVKSEAMSD